MFSSSLWLGSMMLVLVAAQSLILLGRPIPMFSCDNSFSFMQASAEGAQNSSTLLSTVRACIMCNMIQVTWTP